MSLFGQRAEWEGAVSRITRKSEDLPEEGTKSYGYKNVPGFWDKKGKSPGRIISVRGFFSLGRTKPTQDITQNYYSDFPAWNTTTH